MELGGDGVFVDNIGTRAPCFGPKFGKHKHVYERPEPRLRHAAQADPRADQALPAGRGADRQFGQPAEHPGRVLEVHRRRHAGVVHLHLGLQERWFDWQNALARAGREAPPVLGRRQAGPGPVLPRAHALRRQGGRVLLLRHGAAGGLRVERRRAAVAIPTWPRCTASASASRSADEKEENGVYWRAFEAGLVAVNPDREKDGFIAVKPPIPDHAVLRLLRRRRGALDPLRRRRIRGRTPPRRHGGSRGVRCSNAAAERRERAEPDRRTEPGEADSDRGQRLEQGRERLGPAGRQLRDLPRHRLSRRHVALRPGRALRLRHARLAAAAP